MDGEKPIIGRLFPSIRLWPQGMVLLILVAVALLWLFDAYAPASPEALQEIVIAGDDTYPPFEFVDEKGGYNGFNVDLMYALSTEIGVRIYLRPMPWAQALAALEAGEVDAIQGIFSTAERRQQYGFAFSRPYLQTPQSIFVSLSSDIQGPEELADKRVAVQEGDLAEELMARRTVGALVVFENQREALAALSEGLVDAYVGNQYTAQYYVQREYITAIKIVGDALETAPYGMAVRQENRELLAVLNRGLRTLSTNGTLDRIERKWFGHNIGLPNYATRLLLVLGLALAVSLGFVTLLRRQIRNKTLSVAQANQRLAAELQERVQAEEALRQTVGQMSALMENLQMGVVMEDDQGTLRYANERAWDLLGIERPVMGTVEDSFSAHAASYFVDTESFQAGLQSQISSDRATMGLPLRHVDGRLFERDHVPLQLDGQTLGHLWLYHDVTARQHDADRLHRALDQQMAINRLAVAVGQAAELEEICQTLYEHVLALIPVDVFIISFFDPSRQEITAGFCAIDGQPRDVSDFPPLALMPAGEGTQSTVIHTGEPAYIRDLRPAIQTLQSQYTISATSLTGGPAPADTSDDFVQSALYVPMKVRGAVTGVVQAQSYKLDAYGEDDVDLLSVMGNVAAAGIQNVRLYLSAEMRAQRLAVVNRIARSVGAALAMDELLETVYRELSPIMRADAFTIALYDPDHRELDFRIQIDKDIRVPREREPLGEGLISHIIYSGEALLVPDFATFDRSIATPQMWGDMQMPMSWLGVPMRISERIVGVVCVQTYKLLPYGEDDLSLLSTIADQIAVAIERARLYEAVRQELIERQRLEEQLRQVHKMEAVGQLAGGIAHDFNNLLTVINGYSQLALDGLDPDQPIHDDLQAIFGAGQRAARLTRQLLAFSRHQVLHPEILDLSQVVVDLADILRRVLREDIHLQFGLEPRLGVIMADPGQMEQVLVNLAVNAGDAMPSGGTLRIATQNVNVGGDGAMDRFDVGPGSYVLLSVQDDGMGMSDEVKEHLFEPFFTTKEVGKGTGLGLATVYGIVTQSGGQILCESELGRGTTFNILFPLATDSASPVGESPPEPETAPASGNEAILLVEDEASVRAMVADTLRRHGYVVHETSNGREALEWLDANDTEIHLLVSDVVMPEMSGPTLLEELRQRGDPIKAILMSGYQGQASDQVYEIPGQVAFMSKPFALSTLVSLVRQLLDKLS